MKVVSVINYKGGVGKTMLVANLAAYVASRGKRVLMIDLDPQASLTFSFFPVQEISDFFLQNKTILTFFSNQLRSVSRSGLADIIVPWTSDSNVSIDIICSHLGLIDSDIAIGAAISRAKLKELGFLRWHTCLCNALKAIADKSNYDLVLIDCPPNFYTIVKNAITASDYCLVPAKMDFLSTLGVMKLDESIKAYTAQYNKYVNGHGKGIYSRLSTKILGVVPTMVTIQRGEINIQTNNNNRDLLKGKGYALLPQIRYNATIFGADPENYQYNPIVLSSPTNAQERTIKSELETLGDDFIKRAEI